MERDDAIWSKFLDLILRFSIFGIIFVRRVRLIYADRGVDRELNSDWPITILADEA